MKLDTSQILTGVGAMVVGAGVMWGVGLIGKGVDSDTDKRTVEIVNEIVEKALKTDTGETHAATLSTLKTGQAIIITKLEGMASELVIMRQTLVVLAAE